MGAGGDEACSWRKGKTRALTVQPGEVDAERVCGEGVGRWRAWRWAGKPMQGALVQ